MSGSHSALAFVVAFTSACGSGSAPGADPALIGQAERVKLQRRWQGAWVMPFRTGDPSSSSIGTREVWAIDGDRMIRWDGEHEEQRTLTLPARCLARLSWKDPDGSKSFGYRAFGFRDGELVIESRIGVRDRSKVTVCSDLGGVYVLDGTACRFWSLPRGSGGVTAATCTWAGDRLELSSPGDVTSPHSLRLDGDLLRDTELPVSAAKRFDTLDAAKASLL